MPNKIDIELELELLAAMHLNTWFTTSEDVRNFVDLVNHGTGKSYRDCLTDYVEKATWGYQDLADGINSKDIANAAIDIAQVGSDSVLDNVVDWLICWIQRTLSNITTNKKG